jgi:hypothetical protein
MDDFILQTLSGCRLNFQSPDITSISIEDIAHSLSFLCRFNGHSKFFFSVAQHSLLVYMYVKDSGHSQATQLGALLHDAQEAYVSDLPTPLKRMLPMYIDIEKKVQHAIFCQCGIEDVFQNGLDTIKSFDNEITSIERHCLLDKARPSGTIKIISRICEQPPQMIKNEFIYTAKKLFETLKGVKK